MVSTKKCAFCAEEIQVEAIKCRFCGSALDEEAVVALEAKKRHQAQAAAPPATTAGPSGIAIAALGTGVAGVVMPYFAAVFLVPTAFILGVMANRRGEQKYGTWAIILSVIGLLGIGYTSYQLTSINNDLQQQLRNLH